MQRRWCVEAVKMNEPQWSSANEPLRVGMIIRVRTLIQGRPTMLPLSYQESSQRQNTRASMSLYSELASCSLTDIVKDKNELLFGTV